MEKSSLLSGGLHYDLLVNWEKRLSNEVPFLTDFLKNFQHGIQTILEVGCGTGHHAEILQNNLGYEVTGIDNDATMIKEAKKKLPEAEMIVHDFLDPKILDQRIFDAIISLGNSVGLIAETSNFKVIIKRFSELLRTPGLLIFHLLNTTKKRQGWSAPRSIITTEGEFIFLRGFSTTERYIHPEILTLYRSKNGGEWEMTSTGKAHIPRINQSEMTSILEKYNFSNIKVFGDYQKSRFDPLSSIDMIYVCELR